MDWGSDGLGLQNADEPNLECSASIKHLISGDVTTSDFFLDNDETPIVDFPGENWTEGESIEPGSRTKEIQDGLSKGIDNSASWNETERKNIFVASYYRQNVRVALSKGVRSAFGADLGTGSSNRNSLKSTAAVSVGDVTLVILQDKLRDSEHMGEYFNKAHFDSLPVDWTYNIWKRRKQNSTVVAGWWPLSYFVELFGKSERVIYARSSVSNVFTGLEALGIIEKVQTSLPGSKKRPAFIRITEKGRQYFEDLHSLTEKKEK